MREWSGIAKRKQVRRWEGMVRPVRWLVLALASITFSTHAHAAPPPLKVNGSTAKLSFSLADGFKISGVGANGTVYEAYPPGAAQDVRKKQQCRVAANSHVIDLATDKSADCVALLTAFLNGDRSALAISVENDSAYGLLELDIAPYIGKATTYSLSSVTPLGDSVRATSNAQCFVFLDIWYAEPCLDNQGFTPTLNDAVKARLDHGDKVSVFVQLLDGSSVATASWHRFAVQLGTSQVNATDPLTRCHEASAREKLSLANTYYICVDASVTRPSIVVLDCASNADCSIGGDVVTTNRPFVVAVWSTDNDVSLKVTLSGTPGSSSGIYDPTATAKAAAGAPLAPGPGAPRMTQPFGARRSGQATLLVSSTKLKDGAPNGELVHLEYTLTIQDRYSVLIRLGLAFAWQPSARTVGILATPNGQRYAAITEGDPNGLYRTEVVTGATYVFGGVRQDSLDVRFGLGLRVGLLSFGSSITAFSSFMAGPELVIGPELSLGIFAGVGLHSAPDNGYEPGSLVPAAISAIPTHLTATPSLALVLNFTSSLSKSIGVSK